MPLRRMVSLSAQKLTRFVSRTGIFEGDIYSSLLAFPPPSGPQAVVNTRSALFVLPAARTTVHPQSYHHHHHGHLVAAARMPQQSSSRSLNLEIASK